MRIQPVLTSQVVPVISDDTFIESHKPLGVVAVLLEVEPLPVDDQVGVKNVTKHREGEGLYIILRCRSTIAACIAPTDKPEVGADGDALPSRRSQVLHEQCVFFGGPEAMIGIDDSFNFALDRLLQCG